MFLCVILMSMFIIFYIQGDIKYSVYQSIIILKYMEELYYLWNYQWFFFRIMHLPKMHLKYSGYLTPLKATFVIKLINYVDTNFSNIALYWNLKNVVDFRRSRLTIIKNEIDWQLFFVSAWYIKFFADFLLWFWWDH